MACAIDRLDDERGHRATMADFCDWYAGPPPAHENALTVQAFLAAAEFFSGERLRREFLRVQDEMYLWGLERAREAAGGSSPLADPPPLDEGAQRREHKRRLLNLNVFAGVRVLRLLEWRPYKPLSPAQNDLERVWQELAPKGKDEAAQAMWADLRQGPAVRKVLFLLGIHPDAETIVGIRDVNAPWKLRQSLTAPQLIWPEHACGQPGFTVPVTRESIFLDAATPAEQQWSPFPLVLPGDEVRVGDLVTIDYGADDRPFVRRPPAAAGTVGRIRRLITDGDGTLRAEVEWLTLGPLRSPPGTPAGP